MLYVNRHIFQYAVFSCGDFSCVTVTNLAFTIICVMEIKSKYARNSLQTSYYQVHPSIVCNRFIPFYGVAGCFFLLEPIPAVSGRGQGTPWTSRQLAEGPSLMVEAVTQGANCTSGAIWGSLSCSRTLPHAAQPGAGFWTSDLPITSRPALPAELQPPVLSRHQIKNNLYIYRIKLAAHAPTLSVCTPKRNGKLTTAGLHLNFGHHMSPDGGEW